MQGLPETRSRVEVAPNDVSPAETEWVNELLVVLRSDCVACDTLRMTGDEMEPRIRDGDMLFVDRADDKVTGNGIYALEVDGRLMVRQVESRLGTALIFKCEKQGYDDYVVRDFAAAKRMGLRVIGKVRGAVGITRFWNR